MSAPPPVGGEPEQPGCEGQGPSERPAEPVATSRRRTPRRLLRVGAVGVGVGVALVVGEVALRVAGVTAEPKRHFDPGIFRADDELGWALVPDFAGVYRDYEQHIPTTTNAAGFRGPSWPEAQAAELRVVALGDSCTFGLGVPDDDAYPAQLQALLRERGREAVVYNLGVMGYDTHQEARLWDRLAAELAPQVVVLGWLPNDATPADAKLKVHVREGFLVEDEEEFEEWRDRSQRRGINGSVLYRVLRVKSKRLKQALDGGRGKWRPDWVDAEALAPSLASLSRIHARCEAIGARLIVVFFPRREELDDPELSLAHYDLVRAHVESLGGSVVDLPHAWREQRPAGELYVFRDNTHFTSNGYADLARRLADAILPE